MVNPLFPLLIVASMVTAGVSWSSQDEDRTMPDCEDAALVKIAQGGSGVVFQVKNTGRAASARFCLFDDEGNKVRDHSSAIPAQRVVEWREALPAGQYFAKTEITYEGPSGGEVAAGHTAELRICRTGSYVAPSTLTSSGNGFGIIAESGYCSPLRSVAAAPSSSAGDAFSAGETGIVSSFLQTPL